MRTRRGRKRSKRCRTSRTSARRRANTSFAQPPSPSTASGSRTLRPACGSSAAGDPTRGRRCHPARRWGACGPAGARRSSRSSRAGSGVRTSRASASSDSESASSSESGAGRDHRPGQPSGSSTLCWLGVLDHQVARSGIVFVGRAACGCGASGASERRAPAAVAAPACETRLALSAARGVRHRHPRAPTAGPVRNPVLPGRRRPRRRLHRPRKRFARAVRMRQRRRFPRQAHAGTGPRALPAYTTRSTARSRGVSRSAPTLAQRARSLALRASSGHARKLPAERCVHGGGLGDQIQVAHAPARARRGRSAGRTRP